VIRDVRRVARLLVLPTLALGVVLAFAPGRTGLALRIYALVVCGAALLLVLGALRRAYPPESPLHDPWHRTAPARTVPGMLARLEQEVALGAAGSFDLHHRLRPRIRTLADELLAARRGVSLEESPARARALLGEAAWDLVRPDRPAPADRLARGLPINDLRRVVESLERL
jgi:hypothetical protein